jgi:signal peptidase
VDGHTVTVRRLPVRARPEARPSDGAVAQQPPVTARLRLLRKVGRLALNLIFVAVMLSVTIMLGPAVLGFKRYVILTGSMTGTYDRGSIVYDRPVPVSDLKVGDPITYAPPPGFTSQKLVTHRIWSISRGTYGQRVFKTKGDANQAPDVWKFTLNQSTQDRVVFHIPDLGYVFILLSLRDFRMALIGVPALIVVVVMLRGLWREGGEEQRRQNLAKLGWHEQADSAGQTVLPPLDVPAAHRMPVLIDLRLRRVRASASRLAGRPGARKHSRLRVGAPLQIRRLSCDRDGEVPHGAREALSGCDPLATGTTRTTYRLRVGTLAHAARTAERCCAGVER